MKFFFSLLAVVLLLSCSKKEEEKIVITLQTEKIEEAPKAAPPPPERPAEAIKPPPPTVSKKGPVRREEAPPPPPTSPASPPPALEVPPSQPPPPPEAPPRPPVEVARITPEGEIREIVDRQSQAFRNRNADLYLRDLATVTPKIRSDIESFFKKVRDLSVDFSVEQIQVEGERAEVSLIQKTNLLEQSGRSVKSRVKVLWVMRRHQDGWKIAETKVVERYE